MTPAMIEARRAEVTVKLRWKVVRSSQPQIKGRGWLQEDWATCGHEDHRIAGFRDPLVQAALRIAERASERRRRHDALAHLVRNQDERAPGVPNRMG